MKTGKSETWHPYLVLNWVFAAVLLLVMLYAIINSPEKHIYPIPSGTRLFFGTTSPGSGLSHSFSAIVRLDFQLAKKFNPYGLRIFLFFFIQLCMRFSALLLINNISGRALKRLILADSVVSAVLLLVCFWPFLYGLITLLLFTRV